MWPGDIELPLWALAYRSHQALSAQTPSGGQVGLMRGATRQLLVQQGSENVVLMVMDG